MEDITTFFSDMYRPRKGLVIYSNPLRKGEHYVESFDLSPEGLPINFHPLSDKESLELAKTLYPSDPRKGFLHCDTVIPESVLVINSQYPKYVIWYTQPKKQVLYFSSGLGIPCKEAYVPALLWKASPETLTIYALKDVDRPTDDTKLYHAPFFNTGSSGGVCMGNVDIDISETCSLTTFITKWEKYFFASYFSHAIQENTKTKRNLCVLWRELMASGEQFPIDQLLPARLTLKSLIQ